MNSAKRSLNLVGNALFSPPRWLIHCILRDEVASSLNLMMTEVWRIQYALLLLLLLLLLRSFRVAAPRTWNSLPLHLRKPSADNSPVWAQNSSLQTCIHMTFTSENYWGVNLLTYLLTTTTTTTTTTAFVFCSTDDHSRLGAVPLKVSRRWTFGDCWCEIYTGRMPFLSQPTPSEHWRDTYQFTNVHGARVPRQQLLAMSNNFCDTKNADARSVCGS